MLHEEVQQLSKTPRDLRKFGLVVGGVFLVIGGWLLFRQKWLWPYFLVPGGLLVALGLIAPRSLKGVYLCWMTMAFALGIVVSNVILTLFYFVVITPIGLAARLFGKDFLSLKLDAGAKSYWLARDRSLPRQPTDYERQF